MPMLMVDALLYPSISCFASLPIMVAVVNDVKRVRHDHVSELTHVVASEDGSDLLSISLAL